MASTSTNEQNKPCIEMKKTDKNLIENIDASERNDTNIRKRNHNDLIASCNSSEIMQKSDDVNKKPKKKKKKNKKHIPTQVYEFRRKIQICCKNNDLHSAIQAYNEVKMSIDTKMETETKSMKGTKTETHSDIKGLRVIETQTFNNLIALCDGFDKRIIHIGTPVQSTNSSSKSINGNTSIQEEEQPNKDKNNEQDEANINVVSVEVSPKQRREFATLLQDDMASLSIPLSETSYTSLIRLFSKTHHVDEAYNILKQALKAAALPHSNVIPKIRMFTALLNAYAELNDLQNILILWETIQHIDLSLTEKEYGIIMKCATSTRDLKAMDKILTEFAEEVLVPSRYTTNVIKNWFRPNSDTSSEKKAEILDTTEKTITTTIKLGKDSSLLSMSSLRPTTVKSLLNTSESDICSYKISSKCQIDSTTGILQNGCLANAHLQPIPVSKEAQSLLLTMNETIVLSGKLENHKSPFQGGRKGKKRIPEKDLMTKRIQQWTHFKNWLNDKVGSPSISYTEDDRAKVTPTISKDEEMNHINKSKKSQYDQTKTIKRTFDVVLDGANIGYFKTNFNGAPKHVDYHQINWVIQHLNEQGKNVLLILHERHFHSNLMPSYAKPIVQSWMNDNDENNENNSLISLYKAPFGSNDDWFWFHAAVWCGEGTMVVTNDEMRDHFFQMLAHGMFLRWKERHQIHFSFGDWDIEGKDGKTRRAVNLNYPALYSRRIQRVEVPKLSDTESLTDKTCANKDSANNDNLSVNGIVIPLPKRGDENLFLDGLHTADTNETEEETYCCIRFL